MENDGSAHDRARLTGAPAVRLHLTLALGLALCLGAGAFELSRALGGNTLSWAYVFEWPIFGAFAVYMWWKLLHEGAPSTKPSRAETPMSADDQERLDAWNRYLAELHADEAEGPGR